MTAFFFRKTKTYRRQPSGEEAHRNQHQGRMLGVGLAIRPISLVRRHYLVFILKLLCGSKL